MNELMQKAENGLYRVGVYDFSKPDGKGVIAIHVFRSVDERGLTSLLYQMALHHMAEITDDTVWYVCVDKLPLDVLSKPVQAFNWSPARLFKFDPMSNTQLLEG